MEEILIVDNLRKTFKLTRKQQKINKTNETVKIAVDGLSFTAYKGEIYGLLGPNGAGKTTTLRMISSLIKADSGDAIVNGVSVVKNPEGVRGKIGFLTSELKLEDFFTPNYLYDYFSELHQVPKDIALERKDLLFKKFGVDSFKEVKIADLSTGMKQKISLIISIVHNPDIIIFDEPTNGLDVITAKVVTNFLQELKKEGKTVVLSTHIFSLVEKLCDRVGIIINGKMVVSDTLSSIVGNKTLEEVFFEIYEKEVGEE
ncbi:MAG: ABC transporter ATP-binding protein [Anaeroplasmataceae bacterium]|nr:ABC transporter ATP-binding protein [Anaeroplasmataceae bacterium]